MHRTKLEPRDRKCVFLGYKNGMNGVVIYDINNHEVFVSKHFTHHTHIFSYLSNNTSTWDYHVHTNSELTSSSDITNA